MKTLIRKLLNDDKKVISLNHGIGEVVKVYKMYDGLNDFIQIKFEKNDKTIMFPLRDKGLYRVISNNDDLKDNLIKMSKNFNSQASEGGLNLINGIDVDNDLHYLIEVISIMSDDPYLSSEEKNLLSLCINSLVLEVAYVYKLDEPKARGIVSDYMRCA